jgi:hypothetical protein
VIPVPGDQASVQAAVEAAPPGSIIQIQAGSHSWTNTLTIDKPITLTGETPETTIVNNRSEGALVFVVQSTEGIIEIHSLNFVQGNTRISVPPPPPQPVPGVKLTPTQEQLFLEGFQNDVDLRLSDFVTLAVLATDGGKPVLVHDCTFSGRRPLRAIEWEPNGGVIYGCHFISADQSDLSGIAFKNTRNDVSWQQPSSLGMAGDPDGTKNTYVEDCTFTDIFLQAIDFDDNSRAVVRHCTFDNSAISSHGADTSPSGMRQFEVYNNEFIFTLGGNCTPNPFPLNLNYTCFIRGGTGVITDNIFPQISSCAWGSKSNIRLTVYNIRRTGQVACQTSYPAFRQIGQGPDGTTDPLYIWNNTGSAGNAVSLVDYEPDDCGNNQTVTDYLHLDRDYIIAPRPNYQKFTYPHPLRR